MNFLITGGAGFIGSHLVDSLVSQGENVTILDNFSTGKMENLAHVYNKVHIKSGDIRDSETIERLVGEADVVFHLAAALGVKNIMEHTIESIHRNFTGSDVVLHAAAKLNKRLFIASTSEIYGRNPVQPLNEESDRVVGPPQKIRWTYSDAKALEEATAYTLHRTHGLKVTCFRFFNTVGPRQTGQYGMVLPRFVESALRNENLTVFNDGTQTRVFCHVADSIDAMLLALNSNSTIGDYFNVGGTDEISIKDLADIIISKTQSKSQIVYVPADDIYPGGFDDMQRRVPDISKIKQVLGWSPQYKLDGIIESVIQSKLSSSN